MAKSQYGTKYWIYKRGQKVSRLGKWTVIVHGATAPASGIAPRSALNSAVNDYIDMTREQLRNGGHAMEDDLFKKIADFH